MQFEVAYTEPGLAGRLSYLAEEYSFVFQADELPRAVTTIQLNTLQLAVSDRGRILYPWGYCPLIRFAPTEFLPPPCHSGALSVLSNEELVPGVAVRLNSESGWLVAINRQQGWVCIGDPIPPRPNEAVEFANSAVAVLAKGMLTALWLRPSLLPRDTHF